MVVLDLKKGVAGGNTPPKVYLVALERLCRDLAEKFRLVNKIRFEKQNKWKENCEKIKDKWKNESTA